MRLKDLFPDAHKCYQCLSCTLSCPVARHMDLKPHEVLKAILLGGDSQVLSSRTLWICASCETCGVRCPNGINLSFLMDLVRQRAVREGRDGKEVELHRAFLDQVRRRGRVYELGLVLRAKALSGMRFSVKEVILGLKMFLKGKLRLLPPSAKGQEELGAIFGEKRP